MPFAVQLKSTNYLHFVDVELLNFFLISWKYLPFFHRRGNVSSDCQHAPSFVSFFWDLLLKICAILHLERNPPSAKIPAASPDHLLCTDTNDLGEIPGRGVCINKILIQGFSLGNILCRIREIHMTISWNLKDQRNIYSEICFKSEH